MSKQVLKEMPLRAQRPAPPPPASGKQQSKKTNLNGNLINFSSSDSNNNRQGTLFSWPTVIRPSAATTTTNSSKVVKKKPPPRPAPPKNYQTSKKAGDPLASPTPDLLADLADIFSAPAQKTSHVQPRKKSNENAFNSSSSSLFKSASHSSVPGFTLNQTSTHRQQQQQTSSSSSSSFPFRPTKKYPAPVPSRDKSGGDFSLIDFDTPVGTAHLTPSNTLALASAVNRHKSLIDWDTEPPKAANQLSSRNSAFDLLSGNSPLNCPVPALSAQNAVKAANSPAANFAKQQAVSFTKQHQETVINWGVKSVKEEIAAREFSPPEPKFPPPPAPPGVAVDNEEEEEWQHMSVLEVCRVMYDFAAENPGDLSLRAGDRVEVEVKQSKDWWTGRCNGRAGVFPSNFVQSETAQTQKEKEDQKDGRTSGKEGTFAKVLYTFAAEQDTDLALQEGETVKVLYRINQDWLYGQCRGKEGQFPASFVSKINTASAQTVCRALYAFQAENSEELSLREGDRIVLIEKNGEEWWRGKLESDSRKVGLFPATFVEMCS